MMPQLVQVIKVYVLRDNETDYFRMGSPNSWWYEIGDSLEPLYDEEKEKELEKELQELLKAGAEDKCTDGGG